MPLHAFQAAARRFAFALSFSLRCPSTMARTSPIVTVWMQIDRPSFHCDGTAHRSSSVCGWSLIVSLSRGLAHQAGDSQSLRDRALARRSEEHTSELQSLMRISYAVFCLKKKQNQPSTVKT